MKSNTGKLNAPAQWRTEMTKDQAQQLQQWTTQLEAHSQRLIALQARISECLCKDRDPTIAERAAIERYINLDKP